LGLRWRVIWENYLELFTGLVLLRRGDEFVEVLGYDPRGDLIFFGFFPDGAGVRWEVLESNILRSDGFTRNACLEHQIRRSHFGVVRVGACEGVAGQRSHIVE
jgi:hypothetical protein